MEGNVKTGRLYVCAKEGERLRMIEFLESLGYELGKDEFLSREEIKGHYLPLSVDIAGKSFGMMGNATCAAAAASSGSISSTDDFYRIIRSVNPKEEEEKIS